jgi:hypothetical protein
MMLLNQPMKRERKIVPGRAADPDYGNLGYTFIFDSVS